MPPDGTIVRFLVEAAGASTLIYLIDKLKINSVLSGNSLQYANTGKCSSADTDENEHQIELKLNSHYTNS